MDGITCLKQSIEQDPRAQGYSMHILALKKPKFRIVGVPVGLPAADITNYILTQNTRLQGTPQDAGISSDYINRNGIRIITIAASIPLYRQLKQLTHLDIGWVSCALFQQHNIPTYKLCATIDHVGKHCRNRFRRCVYCAEPHTVDQCP
ncbi:hypothetical protein HPB48_000431 [Haemaphysalis longicornis]|uniref:Uncharacterized protein n=1 Tax=Haemaphysalis longicornis TaxID=44386 RepID=A0A9J6FNC7_HAELO|nr:hypothetical protein HPB48_000431 [Haemaphysalis longicornis]